MYVCMSHLHMYINLQFNAYADHHVLILTKGTVLLFFHVPFAYRGLYADEMGATHFVL